MIPVLGSPRRPPPPPPWYPHPARPGPIMPNPCDCAHFSHMAAPKPSTVTRSSSPTHPILVTVDAFHRGFCHEGIEHATVNCHQDRVPVRPASCMRVLNMQLSPGSRSCQARVLWPLTQERSMMMMMTISKHPGRQTANHITHHRGAEGLTADPNPEPHHTPQGSGGTESRPQPRTTPHSGGI